MKILITGGNGNIAKMILDNDDSKINILNPKSNNYSGNGSLLKSLNIDIMGLEDSLKKYESLFFAP